jgi:SAM-dependent methyltransferase
MNYLMEDSREAERLAAKVNAPAWVDRYLASQCARANHVLDVGCGPGVIAAELAKRFPATDVVGLDMSTARLAEARRNFAGLSNASTIQAEATQLPFADQSFDLIYCRFLLEYLQNRAQAVREMARVCRPGGTVVLQDLDGQLVWHYPTDSELEKDLGCVLGVLAKSGFDPFVGRKLFNLARQAGLCNPTVQIDPYHVIAGTPTAQDLRLWELKLDIALPAVTLALGDAAAAKELKARFLEYLRRDDTLTYSVLFTVNATKSTLA